MYDLLDKIENGDSTDKVTITLERITPILLKDVLFDEFQEERILKSFWGMLDKNQKKICKYIIKKALEYSINYRFEIKLKTLANYIYHSGLEEKKIKKILDDIGKINLIFLSMQGDFTFSHISECPFLAIVLEGDKITGTAEGIKALVESYGKKFIQKNIEENT